MLKAHMGAQERSRCWWEWSVEVEMGCASGCGRGGVAARVSPGTQVVWAPGRPAREGCQGADVRTAVVPPEGEHQRLEGWVPS